MTGNFRYFYLSETVASFEKACSVKPIFTKGKGVILARSGLSTTAIPGVVACGRHRIRR